MNKIFTSTRIPPRALNENHTGSALKTRGIIIGTAAAIVAVGVGAMAKIQNWIQSIRSKLIVVLAGHHRQAALEPKSRSLRVAPISMN